jgi:hypothetical protein
MNGLVESACKVLVGIIKRDIYSQMDGTNLPVIFHADGADKLMISFEIDDQEYTRYVSFREVIEFEIGSRAIHDKEARQDDLIEFADSLQGYVDMIKKEIDILHGPPPWAKEGK